MAKYAHPDYLDGGFNLVKASADTITYVLCEGSPTTRAEAVGALKLASTTLNKATEITLANGDVSGRKMVMAAKASVPVTVTGTGDHVALCDATRLLLVTEVPPQDVSAGGTVDIDEWQDEIRAPV